MVWKILDDGKYIINKLERRALTCVNKYLKKIYRVSSEELEWFFCKKKNYASNYFYSKLYKKCLFDGHLDILEWLDDKV